MNPSMLFPRPATPAGQALSTDPVAGFNLPAIMAIAVVVGVVYMMTADTTPQSQRGAFYR